MILLSKIEAPNNLGRIELSPNSNTFPYLVYGYAKVGTVALFDTNKIEELPYINCHSSTILKIAINYHGSLLATSSI